MLFQMVNYQLTNDAHLQRNQKGVVLQVTDRDVGTTETSRLVVPSQRKRKQ